MTRLKSSLWPLAALMIAAIAVFGLAVALPPATAADVNGSSAGTLTVTPNSGTWTNVSGKDVATQSTLACPASTISRSSDFEVTRQAVVFVGRPGKESPALSNPVIEKNSGQFTALKDSFIAYSFGSPDVDQDKGTVSPLAKTDFPGVTTAGKFNWGLTTDGSTVSDITKMVQPGQTYSLVEVCFFTIFDSTFTPTYQYEPDSTGHLRAAWSTLTVAADSSWTVTPTDTSTATSTSPTGTNSATSTGSSTQTTSPSSDPTNNIPTNLPPNAKTILGPPMTVKQGQNYSVNVPAGTFTASDTIGGAIFSDPIELSETATSAADGSVVFNFTVPEKVPDGKHALALVGMKSENLYLVPLQVGEIAAVTASSTSNNAFEPLTNWVSNAVSSSSTPTFLFAGIVILTLLVLVAWRLLLRRNARRH